ncbi:hypothetical protein CHU98_g5872 [Xylaria longipes]|nr:hypothetical protein CHU98_g5872 [Xylaria longipes]
MPAAAYHHPSHNDSMAPANDGCQHRCSGPWLQDKQVNAPKVKWKFSGLLPLTNGIRHVGFWLGDQMQHSTGDAVFRCEYSMRCNGRFDAIGTMQVIMATWLICKRFIHLEDLMSK